MGRYTCACIEAGRLFWGKILPHLSGFEPFFSHHLLVTGRTTMLGCLGCWFNLIQPFLLRYKPSQKGGREEGTDVKLRETVLEGKLPIRSLARCMVVMGLPPEVCLCLGSAFERDSLAWLALFAFACRQVGGVSCGCKQSRDLALNAAVFIGRDL